MQDVSQMCCGKPAIQASEVAMSTTTIRLPDELKARVARAAKDAGTTAHGFIVDAIAEKIEAHERRNAFHAEAQQRWAASRMATTRCPGRMYASTCSSLPMERTQRHRSSAPSSADR
ncbi:CopG family ribbon-helix-helix protein [Xanthomonas oryzae]|uniref:CopG family ribbon-helix-helix protein n=1 Tax=Xanthomonas oryzae TaxID=347 RepID=UPI001F48781B|nr:ribbon-helix-helix domain-containing protein [Xanthomonas oryzae]UWI56152.1 ribbon-helix-helix domain-containing protein [Xanthomonas oryzae pv. oryzae]